MQYLLRMDSSMQYSLRNDSIVIFLLENKEKNENKHSSTQAMD